MKNSRRQSASLCLARLRNVNNRASIGSSSEESEILFDESDASFHGGSESESSSSQNSESKASSSRHSPSGSGSDTSSRQKITKSSRRPTRSLQTRKRPAKTLAQKVPQINDLVKTPMQLDGSLTPALIHSRSPLLLFMSNCRRRQWQRVGNRLLPHFKAALDGVDMQDVCHPFSVYKKEHRSELEKCQRILFPDYPFCFVTCPIRERSIFLPSPGFSPTYGVSMDAVGSSYRTLERFNFDPEYNLLYVGGTVRCLAWCPSSLTREQLLLPETRNEEHSFLAVVSYPTPGTRVFYSDPRGVDNGLIQIWDCGTLALTENKSVLNPRPHLLVTHRWGHVTDMCWLPVSKALISRPPTPLEAVCSTPSIPLSRIRRVLGHLLVASRDGQVRLFSVPRGQLNPAQTERRSDLPIFQLVDSHVIKLSVCSTELPKWIGWPTRIHIRKEFPHRLFVGYSTGHVAYYDLASLNTLVSNMTLRHLAPVRVFRLINGPVRSLSLHPLNGRLLLTQGFDTHVRVWDIEDTAALTPESPELAWTNIVGLISAGTAGLFWLPPLGDYLCFSRDCCFPKALQQLNSKSKSRAMHWQLSNLVDRLENAVCMTSASAPSAGTRQLMPLGMEANSSLDHSEALNTLLCATDRGRLEAITLTTDDRLAVDARRRYLPALRYPLCRWTIAGLDDPVDGRKLGKPTYAQPPKSGDVLNYAQVAPDPECPDCQVERSYCWHRLWSQDKLWLYLADSPAKPFVDFEKTPLLNISQARFSPNLESATWIAVGTSLGFVQLLCAEALHIPGMDQLLNRAAPPPAEEKLEDWVSVVLRNRGGRRDPRTSTGSQRRAGRRERTSSVETLPAMQQLRVSGTADDLDSACESELTEPCRMDSPLVVHGHSVDKEEEEEGY